MPSEKEIPLTEYLADALRHIEVVAAEVQGVAAGIGVAGLGPRVPRVFGRACDLAAGLLPRPFGRACTAGPESFGEPRTARAARPRLRRPGRARKRVKR